MAKFDLFVCEYPSMGYLIDGKDTISIKGEGDINSFNMSLYKAHYFSSKTPCVLVATLLSDGENYDENHEEESNLSNLTNLPGGLLFIGKIEDYLSKDLSSFTSDITSTLTQRNDGENLFYAIKHKVNEYERTFFTQQAIKKFMASYRGENGKFTSLILRIKMYHV